MSGPDDVSGVNSGPPLRQRLEAGGVLRRTGGVVDLAGADLSPTAASLTM